MQSLSWYIRRLRSMSPSEVLRRVRSAGRDRLDRLLLRRRQRPRSASVFLADGPNEPGFRLEATGSGAAHDLPDPCWQERLAARADAIAARRLTFFDLVDKHLGDPIDWNRDHAAGVAAPMIFAPAIDYRDFRVTGDCKYVWEPSRHHHLVVLGRAYRATGRLAYARAALDQWQSWIDQCPYGLGMQWRSGLELGIRLINWVWMLELIAPSGLVSGRRAEQLLDSVDRHVWEIARKYSHGSSANNHLVGEAAGVYVACRYFPRLRRSGRLGAEARDRLIEQLAAQTNDDGGHREQAVGYHLFVAQFFLIAGLVGRWTGQEFPPAYWRRLERMFEFLAALGEGGRQLPMFGDADDGYVLDLGDDPRDWRGWLSAAAVAFARADFKAVAGTWSQTAWWLFGPQGRERFDALAPAPPRPPLASRAFARTGYYLLQADAGGVPVSAVFDCGELGLGPIAGHGHADALSLVLRLDGQDVLVDPGTYDYFTYPAWRAHFRSTRAHNTVEIDDQDQSVMQGLFLWGRKARSRLLSWEPSATGGRVAGQHDGYARLDDPVIHRRSVHLDAPVGQLQLEDELRCRGAHQAALWFHFGESCRLLEHSGRAVTVQAGRARVRLELEPPLELETFIGGPSRAGWVSRGYHSMSPSLSVVGRCRFRGDTTLRCKLGFAVAVDAGA